MKRNITLSDGQEVVIKSAYDCNASRSFSQTLTMKILMKKNS